MLRAATTATTATLLKHDRVLVLGSLVSILVLAWGYLLVLAAGMDDMPAHTMKPDLHAWTPITFAVMFLMWAVMMVAMMLPSATPMLLAFARLARSRPGTPLPVWAGAAFLLGYLALWMAFSFFATGAQWILHAAALLSPHMASVSPILSGALLVFAGLYQFSPLKQACLARCRTPLGFLLTEWRDGSAGAFHMGIRHGIFCIGCCWLLMTLLFVAGVMNILWIAILAVVVLAEKAMASGVVISRATGVCAIGLGLLLFSLVLGF